MKKTMLAVLLSTTMMMTCLAGCSSQTAASGTSAGNSATENVTSEGTADTTGADSGSAAASSDSVKIVAIGVQSGGSYWGNIEKGFTEACAELGWQGDYWTPQNAGNDGEMVQLAENAITQGYNAICMEINDLDMYGDIIARAKEAGINDSEFC